TVNGPHQGAWVTTQTGEDWFLHFQDKDAYGRVVHLQPMKWVNNWPVLGVDKDNDGKGEPVLVYKKPNVGKQYTIKTVADSDEFNETKLGLQWQWQANPQQYWAMPTPNGFLRMFSVLKTDSASTAWNYPYILGQKFPADEFTATAKISFQPKWEGERFGMIVLGMDYAYLSIVKKQDGHYLSFVFCKEADKGTKETVQDGEKLNSKDIYLRVKVSKGAICNFSYSEDGNSYKTIGTPLQAKPGRWVGAKLGLFFSRFNKTNDAGFADIDWFRLTSD
ncbi:MAG: glycoside hydrolase, partial [Chitinophagaceae bacterium]